MVFVSFSSASPLKPSQGHSFVYRTESGKVDLLGKRIKLGAQFYSGYFHTLFPYEDIGFSLNCSYHSGKNSLFCYCHLKKQKECIHQKEKPFWKGERVFFPNVWKSAPCIWNIARRSLIRNHPLCIALYISLYGIEH